jgi:hypothetical protein
MPGMLGGGCNRYKDHADESANLGRSEFIFFMTRETVFIHMQGDLTEEKNCKDPFLFHGIN